MCKRNANLLQTIQQQSMLRAKRKQSFHPKRILNLMVVPSKRWEIAATYHSRFRERSYSKETNCLDDAAFANSDMSLGTHTYITSQIVDASTKPTSHYHHRVITLSSKLY